MITQSRIKLYSTYLPHRLQPPAKKTKNYLSDKKTLREKIKREKTMLMIEI